MRDPEIVESIVAGDPRGLATAYDRYADPLFKYCRTLLSDPADAADAVQDTFVIAASRLDGLRDPERLRAWLYAVARNESLRILRSKKGTSALDDVPDVPDDSVDVSGHAERAELKALFGEAAAGLNPGEREVIDLQLSQGLEAGEVASVLGVSRNHAHSLLSRARDQLETCLGVLLVAKAGRGECGELDSLLSGWDGRLTILLRKRLHRHIERCATCTARRASELRPTMLLGLSPGAALAVGAAASRRIVGAPSALRQHTVSVATGHGPAAARSADVLARAGSFGKDGFPKPAHAAKAGLAGQHGAGGVKGLRNNPQGQAAVAAGVVVAVAAAAFALTANDRHSTSPSAAPKPTVPAASAAARQNPRNAAPKPPSSAAAAGPPASKGKKARQPAPTAAGRATANSSSPPATTPGVTPAAAPAPSPLATAATIPVTSPASAPTTASPAPSPPAARPAPTLAGTLTVTPGGGELFVVPDPIGSGIGSPVSLSETGGNVSWSVTVSNDPNHLVTAFPARGILTAANPTTEVTIAIRQFVDCGSPRATTCPEVKFSPGGATFSISTGWALPFGAYQPTAQERRPVYP